MRSKILISVFLAAVVSSAPGLAADSHGHDHKANYGGVLAEAKDLDYELVVKADSLTLYVADHGKPLATAGGKASATVFAGSEKTTVTLEPAGDNKFAAKGSFKSGVGVRVAVTVALSGKPEAKLNFRLK
jgi:nitrogen fixation protein FixH